ncbi:MAG: DUF937 domain-containing protein [Elainella sp.]
MGLFFDVLSAVNNPNQNASVDQLSSMANMVQQLGNQHGVEPSAMQSVISGLGGALRPALQQQASTGGLGSLMGQLATSQLAGQLGGGQLGGGQFGGGAGGLGGLASLITPQLIQGLTQKTGVNAGTLQTMLPALIPVVMQFLNMGSNKGAGAAANPLTSNPLLKSFLDSDQDQDVDLGDVMKFTGRFLNPAR